MTERLEPKHVERLLRRLPVQTAPESLWSEVRRELDSHGPRRRPSVFLRPVRSPWLAAAAVVVAVVTGVLGGLLRNYAAPGRWAVEPLEGAPVVAGAAVAEDAWLSGGEWLTTDAASRARLRVGRIGTADVGPGSRVRLERGGWTEHRLTLERGSLYAVIEAPPRLFFVQTPAALATDLGCAYTLEVTESGISRLHVVSGWVELREAGAVSLVPAGLVAEVQPGRTPGTPYPAELDESARDALRRLDAGAGTIADLEMLIAALHAPADPITLRKESAITLWHLVQRLDGALRARAFDRLALLAPPPAGVTRDGVLARDAATLTRWRRDLNPMWSEQAETWPARLARRLWERLVD